MIKIRKGIYVCYKPSPATEPLIKRALVTSVEGGYATLKDFKDRAFPVGCLTEVK